MGPGNLPGLRSCSSCLEKQIVANLSSLQRNCVWQFQCFSRFDAPVCLRGEERAWREQNWASVSGSEGWEGSRRSNEDAVVAMTC